jgi:hypothetical protein
MKKKYDFNKVVAAAKKVGIKSSVDLPKYHSNKLTPESYSVKKILDCLSKN